MGKRQKSNDKKENATLKKQKESEEDSTEAEFLESFLFGAKKTNVFLENVETSRSLAVIETKQNSKEQKEKDNEEEEDDNLLSFTISTKPSGVSDLIDNVNTEQEMQLIVLNSSEEKLKPAWVDVDDSNLNIDLESEKDRKKFKERPEEGNVSGESYQSRLKNHFEKITAAPAWADLDAKEKYIDDSDDDEVEGSERTVISTQRFLKKSKQLAKGVINIQRKKDLNCTQFSNATITSLQFHPTSKIAFTTSLNKRLSIFQVDGSENPSLQNIFLERFPIFAARFTCGGNKIVLASRRKHYYVYDLISGNVAKVPGLRGRSEKSLKRLTVSPNGETIAFLGESGYVNFVSTKTNEYTYSLKMNGSVSSAAFTQDSNKLYTTGKMGEVYVWDLRSRRCENKFADDGSIGSTTISVSPNNQYVAVGSSSGVVNLYSGESVQEKSPNPLKTVMNLTTAIDNTCFNPTSEILMLSSPQARNALRLFHLPSLTTFANWPIEKQTIGRVSCADFSPLSGYLGIGNEAGKAMLFRLNHYPDS